MTSEEAGTICQSKDVEERVDEEKSPGSLSHCVPLTMSSVPLSSEIDNVDKRNRPYLPSCYNCYDNIKGSIYIAFLSHICFILASIFYLKLSCVALDWYFYTRRVGVPEDVVNVDTDEVWTNWSNENGADNILDRWEEYNFEYELFYILGALFFVFVGFFDLIRYFDCLNIVLVLAGLAGMISALSKTYQATITWEFVSVHLFFIEAINLLFRQHDYEGAACFRLGDVCFLIGAILDCVGSYVGLAGHEGLWVLQMDVFSCSLWLFSALTDISAEIYYLRKHVGDDGISAVECY